MIIFSKSAKTSKSSLSLIGEWEEEGIPNLHSPKWEGGELGLVQSFVQAWALAKFFIPLSTDLLSYRTGQYILSHTYNIYFYLTHY